MSRLEQVIKDLENSSRTSRTTCLEALKHSLDISSDTGGLASVGEKLKLHLLEILFGFTVTEYQLYTHAKTPATKKTAANRLAECAAAVRNLVEHIHRHIKARTVKALLDHLVNPFGQPRDFVYELIATDYAKSLESVLSFQPHVEHLPSETWQKLISFALTPIRDATSAEISPYDSVNLRLSHDASQPLRGSQKQVVESLLRCILFLTNAPNASISESASDIVHAIIKFLSTMQVIPSNIHDAFAIINNVLDRVVTDNIQLTREITHPLIQLVRQHWVLKLSNAHDELLVTLIYLQPYIDDNRRTSEDSGLESDIDELCSAMKVEYLKRPTRHKFCLDDVHLGLSFNDDTKTPMKTACFAISCRSGKVEHKWGFIRTLALLTKPWVNEVVEETQLEHDDTRKRPRLELEAEGHLESFVSGSNAERLIAIQTFTLLSQYRNVEPVMLKSSAKALLTTCSDDDVDIGSWSYIALSSLATHEAASESFMQELWKAAWHMAARAITTSQLSRAACHLLDVMLNLQLIEQSTFAEFVRGLINSMELNGPTTICDTSLHLCASLRQLAVVETPSSSDDLVSQLLSWLFRQWAPSQSAERSLDIHERLFDASDILKLVFTIFDQDWPTHSGTHWPQLGHVSIAMYRTTELQSLLDYLLLTPSFQPDHHPLLAKKTASAEILDRLSLQRSLAEPLLLGNLIQELSKLTEVMPQNAPPINMSAETFARVSTTCFVSCCIAYDIPFVDQKRTETLQKLCGLLLTAVLRQATQSDGNAKLDILLSLAAAHQHPQFSRSKSRVFLADAINLAFYKRAQYPWTSASSDSSDAPAYSSQSQEAEHPGGSINVRPTTVLSTELGLRASHNSTALFAQFVLNHDDVPVQSQASLIAEHILALSDVDVLLSLQACAQGMPDDLQFSDTDLEQLLELCTKRFFSQYTFNRSEVAIGIVIDFMSFTVRSWTNSASESLTNLGLDMYEWLTNVALTASVLSPDTKQRLAALLMKLCQFRPDYGSQTTDRSARTSLFQMLQDGPTSLQYFLAPRLPAMFRLFTLSFHSQLFDDLQKSLPVEMTWTEGIAMRLCVLAQLGSAWPSLLEVCVYYIFETAGSVISSKAYASRCMQRLSDAVHKDKTTTLFPLFGPQLLYTWLEGHTLSALPFEVFGYVSKTEFLSANLAEIVAQLFLRNSGELKSICSYMGVSQQDALRLAFDRVYAYALSWDIMNSSQEQSCEQRLRAAYGSREDVRRAIKSRYPVIIGRVMLGVHIDGDEEKWLEKRDGYAAALQAYRSMTAYSRSTRPSSSMRQPNYRSKFLPDQLDRLSRRLSLPSSAGLWSPASFSITSQMLLDALDTKLSALQNHAILQTLRLLVAIAGPAALKGPPFELTIRSIAPFLSDSHCADDTIGILFYLLSANEESLSGRTRFTWGTIALMVLRIKQRLGQRQDSTTQESQFRDTIQRLRKFSDWLLDLLKRLQTQLSSDLQDFASHLISNLSSIQLPGKANRDSPECALLLSMLSRNELMDDDDVLEVVVILATDFQVPSSFLEDCLGSDTAAVQYASSLWHVLQKRSISETFQTWAMVVVGRAYVSTGVMPADSPAAYPTPHNTKSLIVSNSLTNIAKQVRSYCSSTDRRLMSLGVFTYRACIESCNDPVQALHFERCLESGYAEVYNDGNHGYSPAFVQHSPAVTLDIGRILASTSDSDLATWASRVAVMLCHLPLKSTLIKGLEVMLQHQALSSLTLLPSIVHIVLADENHKSRDLLRSHLQQMMTTDFAKFNTSLKKKQRLLLSILLYILEQPFPEERTIVERLQWLPCDFLLAARCAAHVGMSTAALKLAELSRIPDQTARRGSSRQSLSRTPSTPIPQDLLLTIYISIDEPDSYYGIEQPSTLHAYLQRTEHEENGYEALLVRSAQVDAQLSAAHRLPSGTSTAFTKSLSKANLNSLAYAFARLSAEDSDSNLDKARLLQQWDIPPPRSNKNQSAILFRATSALVSAHDEASLARLVRSQIRAHVDNLVDFSRPTPSWMCTLGSLVETLELVATSSHTDLPNWSAREKWMHVSPYDSFATIVESRCTTVSALAANANIKQGRSAFAKELKLMEAKALSSLVTLSTEHTRPEASMSAVWRLNDLAVQARLNGVNVTQLAERQLALVMWHANETSTSIKILKGIAEAGDEVADDVPYSKSVLLSQIGKQLADARLQNPSSILHSYLKPSIDKLDNDKGDEAGQVFHTFAAFCDAQLQNTAAAEDYTRIMKLRQTKIEEVRHLKTVIGELKKGDERDRQERQLRKTSQWLKIDEEEYQRVKQSRDVFTQQSLKNYMRALIASNKYDTCILRLYALWLENADTTHAQEAVDKHLTDVPSWKFVVLMNQLMSRLKGDDTPFQRALLDLVYRVCQHHTYQTVHHIYAYRKTPGKDEVARLRREAAEKMCKELARNKPRGELFARMMKADSLYRMLAEEHIDVRSGGKYTLKDLQSASKLARTLPQDRVAPATLDLPLEPDGKYLNVPVITGFANNISIMNGLSAPKVLTAYASDGKHYKQLFKAGNDDLRQDAIMEQVFGEVSKMLRKHKATRQRNLQVRTYKVIPLTARSGIIEFVPNSMPINDFLGPAHQLYFPGSIQTSAARQKIGAVADHSTETRVKEFRKVCDQLPPVLRFFFMERFNDPDDWFSKRTAYTRSTATISMLGYVLGLGDRHCHNILLDEKSGEIIHIDLGVAFETGRVLPIPELVPFRLTRDIVDGMGATGIEGVFRRCCEFTVDALRQDKDDIMTLLNVLRYDPLYSWTLSPLRAKRMQQQQENGDPQESKVISTKKQQMDEAGEAERALGVVEKKLGTTLSTAATVSELIQQAQDERNLATLFSGWSAFF